MRRIAWIVALACAGCSVPDADDKALELRQGLYREEQVQERVNALAFRRAGWTRMSIDNTYVEALRTPEGWHFVSVDDDEVLHTVFVPQAKDGAR